MLNETLLIPLYRIGKVALLRVCCADTTQCFGNELVVGTYLKRASVAIHVYRRNGIHRTTLLHGLLCSFNGLVIFSLLQIDRCKKTTFTSLAR